MKLLPLRGRFVLRPLLVVAAAMPACGGDASTPPADASVDHASDVAAMPDVAPDTLQDAAPEAAIVDAPPDLAPEAAADVPPPDLCAASSVIDLDAMGTRSGSTLVYRGTTVHADGTQVWPPAMGCVRVGRVIRSVAHRLRTEHLSHLAILAAPRGADAPPLAVYVHSACRPSAAPLNCSSSLPNVPEAGNTITNIPAGTTVWIVVSTLSKGDGDPGGDYELRVTESPVRMEGEMCDNNAVGTCVTGLNCVRSPGESIGRCVQVGTVAGAAARSSGVACDAPLRSLGGTCQTPAAVGEACLAGYSFCNTPATCLLDDANWPGGHCVAPGALGGTCSVAMPCADGLSCTVTSGTATGICFREVAVGDACVPNASVSCAAPAVCVLQDASARPPTYRCAAPGSAAGAACASTTPRCAEGLRCSAERGIGYCRAAATDRCVPRVGAADCGAGRVCAVSGPTEGRCVAWSQEPEENNDFVALAATARQPPFAVRGALLPAPDIDCYAIELRETGRLVFGVQDGIGRCPLDASVLIALTTPDRPRTIARFSACTQLQTINAQRRPPGTYVLCVSGPNPVVDYVLTVTAEP